MRIALAVLLLPTLAAADPRPADPTRLIADDCQRARKAGKTCVLALDAEEVTGDTPAGEGVSTRILVFATKDSLIRIRRDFLPEIVKSAEDL